MRNCHPVFHIGRTILHSHCNVWGFQYLHILTNTCSFPLISLRADFSVPISQMKKGGSTQQSSRKDRTQILVFKILGQLSSNDTIKSFRNQINIKVLRRHRTMPWENWGMIQLREVMWIYKTHMCVRPTQTFTFMCVHPSCDATGLTMYSLEYQCANEKLSRKSNWNYSDTFNTNRRWFVSIKYICLCSSSNWFMMWF